MKSYKSKSQKSKGSWSSISDSDDNNSFDGSCGGNADGKNDNIVINAKPKRSIIMETDINRQKILSEHMVKYTENRRKNSIFIK